MYVCILKQHNPPSLTQTLRASYLKHDLPAQNTIIIHPFLKRNPPRKAPPAHYT